MPVGGSPISAERRAFPQLDDPKSQSTIPNQATRLLIHQRIEYEAGQSSTPRALEKPSTVYRPSGRLADLCRRRAFPQLDDPKSQLTIPNQATRLLIHQRIEYKAGQTPPSTVRRASGRLADLCQAQGLPAARRSKITITITISYPQSATRLLIHQRIEYEAGQSSTPRALEKTVHRLPSAVCHPSGRLADLCRAQGLPAARRSKITITITISYPQSTTRLLIHQRIEYEAGQISTPRALEKPSTVHRLPSAVPVGGSPISADAGPSRSSTIRNHNQLSPIKLRGS